MKSPICQFSLCAGLLLAATFLLAGCASLGMGTTAPASASLQSVEDDYRQAQLQTAATEEALDGLAVASDLDLKRAFNFFSGNRDKMEQIGSRLVRHADGMFLRGTYYFVESGKSMEACAFPRSGKNDDQQSINLGEDFNPISEAGGEVKRAFRAFQLDIEQLHDYLANNLTPAGIDSMDLILRKAKVDSDSLQETLKQALTALGHAKTNLVQGAQKKG